jgi:two-component system NarL family sensor kinase
MQEVQFTRLSQPDPFDLQTKWFWIVIGLMLVVLVLEYLTPSAFIFGYLYSGPILLASTRLGRRRTVQVSAIAVGLILLNLWVHNGADITTATVANRVIAAMALVVTGFLGDRNRYYQKAIAQQQARFQAQEQLASVRENFASTLTHDLKTPLLGAIETLNALHRGNFGLVSTIQQSVLATMIRSHQASLQLVETLLDVYRNDTEGLSLTLAPVDLAELTEAVAQTLTELATSRRVYLSVSYGESDFRRSLWVNGDALQLQRVLINLLSNAINHSRRGERVEVVLESQASHQVVKVLDRGPGIQPEEFSRLFDRFYQGYGDRQAKGTGLGLYLARQIIEAHSGIIWAENRSTQGALFGFRLPVYPFPPTSVRTDAINPHSSSVS